MPSLQVPAIYGSSFVALILFIWKLFIPTLDWLLKQRCDKIYESPLAELKEYKKVVDFNATQGKQHERTLIEYDTRVRRIEDVISVLPRTNEILSELKNFVEILTKDMGDMKVMVGRIDERTKVIDANNK